MSKRKVIETSDDEKVEDTNSGSEQSGSEEETPAPKKTSAKKSAAKSKVVAKEEKKSTKAKEPVDKKLKSTGSKGPKEIVLAENRKISYSTFTKEPKIDIREYYKDKNGDLLPGKKGISLSIEQFQTIADNIDTILGWIK